MEKCFQVINVLSLCIRYVCVRMGELASVCYVLLSSVCSVFMFIQCFEYWIRTRFCRCKMAREKSCFDCCYYYLLWLYFTIHRNKYAHTHTHTQSLHMYIWKIPYVVCSCNPFHGNFFLRAGLSMFAASYANYVFVFVFAFICIAYSLEAWRLSLMLSVKLSCQPKQISVSMGTTSFPFQPQ